MTTRYPRTKLEHPPLGSPEYTGDSVRAIARGVRRKRKAIDFNILPTLNFEDIAVEHWARPLLHGWHDPLDELPRNVLLARLRWAQVARLRTREKHPYRIHKAEALFQEALNAGLNVEGDLKAWIPSARLRQLLNALHPRGGAHLSGQVIFKAMATAPDEPWLRLKEAHDAGATTLLLCHRPFIKVPASAQDYIDHYRGFRPRFIKEKA